MLSKTTKNRFGYKLDKIFWFILLLMPILGYFLYLFTFSPVSGSPVHFGSYMTEIFLDGYYGSNNPVYNVLYNIFGISPSISSVFPVLSVGMCNFFTWAISIEVVHVCFDVLVFIPRLAHKWISKAVQDD